MCLCRSVSNHACRTAQTPAAESASGLLGECSPRIVAETKELFETRLPGQHGPQPVINTIVQALLSRLWARCRGSFGVGLMYFIHSCPFSIARFTPETVCEEEADARGLLRETVDLT
ncbi:corticosteroid 11-beta-dehydrogenase isozyme 2 [Lates japonicus]|uniref:Corticosteroid 11-beta-dehydrogenase isozyme 2 n=1 Tax=Lates japonicus TaxID=270547 RepID=A0AAD3NE48_LATJO|nr:corticosteroid 11-beta-dehydrogenase isozyme 2 [Lates japonicus]